MAEPAHPAEPEPRVFARRLPRRDRRSYIPNVAALERSDNVADRVHAFAGLKRGYTRTAATLSWGSSAATPGETNR
jgi:hypothetical protein